MLESDLREMFEWQAAGDQPTAQISLPVVRKRAQIRRRWRRAATIGSPIVAAAAAVAVGLTASLVSGAAGSKTASAVAGPQVAPRRFNPLEMYATFGWLPAGDQVGGGQSFPTALSVATYPSGLPQLVVYSAGQCALTVTRLTCGSERHLTDGAMAVTGRAPDVNGHVAYWGLEIQEALTTAEVQQSGRSSLVSKRWPMLAFQYARGGWALLIYSDRATAMRIAENVRFGQPTPIKFLFRLTGLPRQWRTVQQVLFVRNNLPMHADQVWLGQPPVSAGQPPAAEPAPRSLGLFAGTGGPECGSSSCPLINGYEVYQFHSALSVTGEPTVPIYYLTAHRPAASGLMLLMTITGPRPLLSPLDVFAHHVQMLGLDPADWTTTPISP